MVSIELMYKEENILLCANETTNILRCCKEHFYNLERRYFGQKLSYNIRTSDIFKAYDIITEKNFKQFCEYYE